MSHVFECRPSFRKIEIARRLSGPVLFDHRLVAPDQLMFDRRQRRVSIGIVLADISLARIQPGKGGSIKVDRHQRFDVAGLPVGNASSAIPKFIRVEKQNANLPEIQPLSISEERRG